MIYEHLTKAGEQKASIVSGTTASTASPFSSHAKSSSSAQSQHSLTVENLLNYSTKKSPMPKMDAFEVKPEVKYSNLALNGNASMSSIINESFIKKTLMDEEVKEQQPKRTSFSQPKEDYKSLIDDHVETLKHRMTGMTLHNQLLSLHVLILFIFCLQTQNYTLSESNCFPLIKCATMRSPLWLTDRLLRLKRNFFSHSFK